QSRRQLWDVVQGFKARGRTVLLTTHYMDEAERLCDRVAVVDQGKVIALGSPAELVASLGGQQVIELALENGSAIRDPELERLPARAVARARRRLPQPAARADRGRRLARRRQGGRCAAGLARAGGPRVADALHA